MQLSKEHIRRLLIEKIAGTISEADDQAIEVELNTNPEVQAQWDELRRTMHTQQAQDFLNNLDADQSWKTVSAQLEPWESRRSTNFFQRRQWLAVAAIFVLVISTGMYLFLRNPAGNKAPVAEQTIEHLPSGKDSLQHAVGLYLADGRQINLSDSANRVIDLGNAALNTTSNGMQLQSTDAASVQWSTVAVPAKLDYRIILADGTEVWMNSASSLRFPHSFPDSTREVFLQGEAFFKVTKNAKQPFIVHSGTANIRVLGTSFNVQAYQSQRAIVSLVEGAVKTGTQGHPTETTLKPGFEAVIDSAKATKVRAFKAATTLSWMKGIYYFHDKPLSEINDVLQRWFGLTLEYDDPALSHLTVTGAIEKDQPLTDFLSSLEASAGVKFEIKQNSIYLH